MVRERELDCLCTPISFIVRLFHDLRKCFSKVISSKTSSPSSSPFSWKRLAEKLCFFLKKKRDDSKKKDVSLVPEEPVPEKAVVSKAGECLSVGARAVIPRSRVVELEVGEAFRRKDEGLGLEREMEVEENGYCMASRRGARHRMEDGYGIMTNIHGDSKQAFFRVFNGHGGKEAMVFISDKLRKNIQNALERVKGEDDEVKSESAIRLGYLNTDQELFNKGLSSRECAATMVMSSKGVAHVLTTGHRLGREVEKNQIESSRGYVSCHNGVWTVHGSLAISWALADREEAANSSLSLPLQFSVALASDSPLSFHCKLTPSARVSKMSTAILLPPPEGENCCSSSGSENDMSTSIYDIPTEVFDNILLLMDKNTICRFRCASRWCNERVSNPTFCIPQYRHQLHRGQPLHQINWMEDGLNVYINISTIDWTNPLPHHYNIWPFAHPKKNVMVAASKSSCLGLLCLYGPECACLYNPTTRSVVLDLPPFKYSHRFTTLAFGLLHSTNQLKVVNLTYCPRSSCHARCKVLTIPRDLGSGWREAPSPPFYTTHKPLTASVESSLYFLITYRLFRFDLETEQWSEVKLPLPIRSLPMISEFKGNLYLIAKAKIHFEVWLLREQDVWVKMWALTHNYSGMLMHPMRQDEELERSLIVNRHDQLRWYNIDDGTHKECVGSRLFNIPYVETWASLKTLCDI